METVEGGWSCVGYDQLRDMQAAAAADISAALETLQRAVQGMVELYCSTLHCDYEPVWSEDKKQPRGSKPHHSLQQLLRVKLLALHRVFAEEHHKCVCRVKACYDKHTIVYTTCHSLYNMPFEWLIIMVIVASFVQDGIYEVDKLSDSCSCDAYQVEVCVFHGGRALSKKVYSPPARVTQGFFPMVTWNKWYAPIIPVHTVSVSPCLFCVSALHAPLSTCSGPTSAFP